LGTFAVVKSLTHNDEVSFIFKDHLGSWTAITDYDGDIQQELSFDAWGNLRNPATWSGTFVGTPLYDRGFTGHEHLYSFGLINMNGRMYDPIMSSFLSVDNFVQQPDNSQNFNRYSYCFNNPLRFTDPSGYFVTIPPEFVEMFEYAQDKEYFRDCIMELGINPNTVQYNTDETEGIRKTTVSWMIGNDKYEMVKFDYIYLKDYYQQNRNGCAAISFWALEAQHHPGTYFDENYFMECIPNSYTEGTSVRELCEIFVGTQIEDNYFPGISETYHLYHEKEIFDSNREELLKECFDAFHDGDAMMFLLPSTTIKHDVNATAAARLQINGRSTLNDYSVWIWDSGKTNGGYKPLDLKNVLYRFIIAK